MEARVRRRGGAVRRAELCGDGATPGEVQRAVLAGTLNHPAPRVYSLPGTPPTLVAAVQLGGVISHTSAARLRGFTMLDCDEDKPHVTFHRKWTASRAQRAVLAEVTPHWANLSASDLDPGLPCTADLRTTLDCLRILPTASGLVLADGVVRDRRISVTTLRQLATGLRGPGSRQVRAVVRLVDPQCESVLESLLRLLLVQNHLPFRSQVPIPGVGRVDFLVGHRLVVEADGFTFHSGREEYRRDRARSNALLLHGYRQLRFSFEDVMTRPQHVVRSVQGGLPASGNA